MGKVPGIEEGMTVLIPDAIDRPTSWTSAVREKALKALLPQVLEWLGEEAGDEEQILKQLDSVLNGWNDGFKAAKELEDRYYWDGDSELVDILDGFSDYSIVQDAVKAWVKECKPLPTFKLGDRVIWKRQHCKDIEGRITEICADTAQYIVSNDTDAKGCGTYVNWEDAEAVKP
jgi:hypothetical protein